MSSGQKQKGRRNFALRLKLIAGWCLVLALCRGGGAQTWQRLGPDGGMVVSLGANPQGGLYLGTADGHVFFSGDRAQSWEPRGRVGHRLDAVVTRLVPDPRTENRVFASAWYQWAAGGGVFQSDDGGRTWALLGLEKEAVRALEMAPSRPDVLVAGTRTGVFRSQDSGKNWERISALDDPELHNVDSLAIDPRNPDLIYVGTYHLPWKTSDGGKTWSPAIAGIIDDSDIMSMRIDATNPARLFMSACSGIYRSENQGAEWTKLQGIPYSARRTQAIVQDPGNPDALFAGTTEGLWVTRDGGENWTRTTPKEWDVSSVVVLATNSGGPRRVVLGTEGRGIEVSDDAGVHFSESNEGFTHVIVNQLLADPRDSTHLLMVTERGEERILESRDSGGTWKAISLSTATRGVAGQLPADQAQQFYASYWGWLVRLEDGKLWLQEEQRNTWSEWKLRVPQAHTRPSATSTVRKRDESFRPQGSQIAFSPNAAIVPSATGLLHCLSSGVCNVLKAFGGGGEIRALRVSPNGRDLFVARDGKLGISSTGGESAIWRDLPVANDQVLSVDIEESTPSQTLILATAAGLYLSEGPDAAWFHVRGGLPEAPITHFLRQSNLWAVTELGGGMYISRDRGATWQRVDQDPERGQFTGLAAGGVQVLLVASQSEGLLRLDGAAIQKDAGK